MFGQFTKMAARSDTLQDLQQEITCPLCLDTFDDPRVLSCQHTYCRKCLEALISRSRGTSPTITCPECRKSTEVPVEGVQELPAAFKLNRLIQLVGQMRHEERGRGNVEPDGPVSPAVSPPAPTSQTDRSSCTRHPGQTLDVYCRSCEEVICRDCVLFGRHSGHSYDKLGVAADDHRDMVRQKLNALVKKQPLVQKYAADAKRARHSAEETREVVCDKIAESYDRVLSLVEQKKKRSVQQFRDSANAKVMKLHENEASLMAVSSEMSAVKSMVERGLNSLGDADFIIRKKGMVYKMEQMNTRINELSQDQVVAELTPEVLDQDSLVQVDALCDRFLRPYVTVDPAKCMAHISGGGKVMKVGEAATIIISLRDSEGESCRLQQCVTVELRCIRFGEKLTGKVIERSPSSYESSISPNVRTRGQCQVVAKVNDVTIGTKPIAVVVECPARMLGEPVHIINDIQQPGCLKIYNTRMFCRTAMGICILDLENISKPLMQSGIFPRDGKIESWWPSELLVYGSYLFVSDPRNGKVHKFKLDGQYLKSTATNKDTLQTPNGLSMSPNNTLYVCDSDRHCIHVFNPDMTLYTTFGSQGSAPGYFCWPDNVAFDTSGNFYITDYSNDRIQCFSSNHTLKWHTGTAGGLREPNVMHVVENKIFVTDLGGVTVFNTEGQFITRFASMCAASESKSSADGIVVDSDGFVFVSDTPRNRIVIF